MLDLSNLPSTAAMRLTKAVPRREGSGVSWDLELVQEIPDLGSAEVVDKYLPGAVAVWEAREGSKGSTSTSGGFDLLRATFMDGVEGTKLATGHGEVRGVVVRVNASQAVLTVKLRIHGLLQESAMAVVYALDESIQVDLRSTATQLSLLPSVQAVSLEGRLVVHRTPDGVVSGVVTHHDGQHLQVATLEEAHVVHLQLPPGAAPDTSVEIGVQDGESLRALLVDYVDRCDKARCRSSWQDVITAMGRLYASNQLEPAPDQSWEITQEVLDEALQVAIQVGR